MVAKQLQKSSPDSAKFVQEEFRFEFGDKIVVIKSHESSRCVMNWYDCRRIASMILQCDLGCIKHEKYKPNGRKIKRIYYARWQGKPGGGLDERRLEFKRAEDKTWTRFV